MSGNSFSTLSYGDLDPDGPKCNPLLDPPVTYLNKQFQQNIYIETLCYLEQTFSLFATVTLALNLMAPNAIPY
jgi:hypothetical protein